MKKISLMAVGLFLISSLIFADSNKDLQKDDLYFSGQGLIKLISKDYHGAIADYNKAIELNPNYADAYYNRGWAKYQLKDYHGAIADYNKSIEIDPKYTKAHFCDDYAEAFCNLGLAKEELKDYRGAITDYNKAIEMNLKYAKAYFCRGHTKAQLKDYRGAIADYSKAIELNPKEAAMYYWGRGLAKISIGNKDDGCMDLSKSGELGCEKVYDVIKELCN